MMHLARKGVCQNPTKTFSKMLRVRTIFGNAEEKRERREQILKDFRKGSYLADLKEVKATGGKRYFALDEVFPKKESQQLPHIAGLAISGREVSLPSHILGNVTLLLLWTREHGQKACGNYRDVFLNEFEGTDNLCYEVNILDSWLFRKMQSYIRHNLQLKIPAERQDNYLCCHEDTPTIIQKLFENRLVGHALLIDKDGLVRWKAHGAPTTEELTSLVTCTNYLNNEII